MSRFFVQWPVQGGPILRISSDGKNLVRYSLDSTPSLQNGSISDFAPGIHGDIYLLVTLKGKSSISVFSKDGQFNSEIPLDIEGTLRQLAVFHSETLLVIGQRPGSGANGRNFAAIVNTRGLLIRDLTIDVNPSPSKDGEEKPQARGGSKPFDISVAETADDGNIYMFRFGSEGPVYVITPSGSTRNFPVTPPKGTHLNSIKVGHGRLVAMYSRSTEQSSGEAQIDSIRFAAFDVSDGRKVGEYEGSATSFGMGFACYKPDTFTFLGASPSGAMELQQASPR